MKKKVVAVLLFHAILISACKKGSDPIPLPATDFTISKWEVDGVINQNDNKGTKINPVIRLYFPAVINRASVASSIVLQTANYTVRYENGDSILVIQPTSLSWLSKYKLTISNTLKSNTGGNLLFPVDINLLTRYNPSDKFPRISDNELLDKVQQQTFKYFWDYGHPVSGLARERSNATPETVTSGGSGFGIMSIPVAINRNFITRTAGLQRMQTIVSFLKNTAQKFHGAFPHWLNGSTGAVIPFSTYDDGADLVETSYLMAGLLTVRQYFNSNDVAETALRADINSLFNAVEWSWFRSNNQNVLYWHWSPNYNWQMNLKIQGWNECLITYIMAASSTTYGIPQSVYKEGFARNGAMQNGGTYYGYPLPLGASYGGPLFLAHYSFLGVNPYGLSDTYANYETQVTNHTKINLEYCKANPANWYGYSGECWGLTASDVPNGYNANGPTNDIGVISPTAALSSFPYTPVESMQALKFFYYVLGDKLWGEYGFKDAFLLNDPWFAGSYLAIDQGPIIIMIENYRSGLLWDLFMSCPEVKTGMQILGFSSPHL
ncbi:MAG: beta-glucosidase [Chitinophagaceae bacterium]|nr:beta-glucosidase [Chitinophagaceae bacterium]